MAGIHQQGKELVQQLLGLKSESVDLKKDDNFQKNAQAILSQLLYLPENTKDEKYKALDGRIRSSGQVKVTQVAPSPDPADARTRIEIELDSHRWTRYKDAIMVNNLTGKIGDHPYIESTNHRRHGPETAMAICTLTDKDTRTVYRVFVVQYAPAANRRIIDFPGGLIDHATNDDSSQTGALRELREECPVEPDGKGEIRAIPEGYPTRGLTPEIMQTFLLSVKLKNNAIIDRSETYLGVEGCYRITGDVNHECTEKNNRLETVAIPEAQMATKLLEMNQKHGIGLMHHVCFHAFPLGLPC